jgi:hypothetical protein
LTAVDRKGKSFEDFSLKLLDFEKQVNHRIHTTTKKTPIELFNAEEMAVLSPLPNNRFIGISEEFRKVSSDCLISVDGNRYSVPHIFACRDEISCSRSSILLILSSLISTSTITFRLVIYN